MSATSEVRLRYGRGDVVVRLPPDAETVLIEKPPMPVLEDPAGAVRRALEPLPGLASGGRSACILICDVTRPVPNRLFLRPLIEALTDTGIPLAGITVLVATGLHRPNLGAELAEVVGDPWVLEQVRVVNHDARADAEHVDLGHTSRGTAVRLDRRFVEAEVRIATGLVEPHFMAGYSGGRKVIAPGVAHADTITTFHNYRFMADPRAANCRLEDNPLHAEQLEIVAMTGGALALNTVIDERRRLSFVNFGEVVASHLAAVDFVRGYAEIRVPRRFGTVLTSAAGYPLDKTYYQTVKGMVGPLDILSEGGDLIVASECAEGLGSPEFRRAQQMLLERGVEGFLAGIAEKAQADVDEWQTQMQTKPARRGRIRLFSSGLDVEERRLTGVEMTDSLESAVRDSLERQGSARIAVIPEGPYVIPFYQESVA